jgi:mRNA interferase RelE/StbE
MSGYSVELRPKAVREIDRLQPKIRESVLRRIYALAFDPRPHGSQKLVGGHASYRVRVGDYRIIYAIDDVLRTVSVGTVGHRREVYR